jgi:zinc transport system permease protein
MLDDFFIRALIAGVGLALVAGPLGCFVVWRQMAFFGETMAHAALLGIALSLALAVDVLWGVLGVCVAVAGLLVVLQRRGTGGQAAFSQDTLLGILSHMALAIGLVATSAMSWLRIDIMGFLVGDVLSVSVPDLITIYLGGGLVLAVLFVFWKPLIMATISTDIAQAENRKPLRAEIVLVMLLAITIALAIKIVGVLLIAALLIIPAGIARAFATTPEQMALAAAVAGVVAVAGGLFASLQLDTPSGPSIIIVAGLVFFAMRVLRREKRETG